MQVTVVVVTWEGRDLLRECLASLATQTLPRSEYCVVVVDNASTDGTAQMLASEHPDVEVITAPTNLGFAGGANLALVRPSTPYVVLLNNDATAEPGLLAAFVEAMEAPGAVRVAAVTGKVLLTGTGLINSTGNLMSRTGRGYDRDWQRRDDGSRGAGEVFGFCGAAVALRAEALAEVGVFDGDLFLYYEDTDLSWRLRRAGWTVRFEPQAVAWHRHASSSGGDGNAMFHFWNERNSMVVMTRHAPAALVLVLLGRRLLGLVVQVARHGARHPLTRARLRALSFNLWRLPRTLRERREGWREVAVPRAEVARLLTSAPGE